MSLDRLEYCEVDACRTTAGAWRLGRKVREVGAQFDSMAKGDIIIVVQIFFTSSGIELLQWCQAGCKVNRVHMQR